MNTDEEIDKLKNEVTCLAEKFADSLSLINVAAVVETGKALKSMHLDQSCTQCIHPVSFNLFDNQTHELTAGMVGVEKSITDTSRKSFRKSRKSVCVLPKFISSSESSASEAEDEANDECNDSPVIIRRKGAAASQQIVSSDDDEEQGRRSTAKKQSSHTGMYRINRQTSPGVSDESFDSDETEVDDSMHDTVDGSLVIMQRKENRASQFVPSSEEDEENKYNPDDKEEGRRSTTKKQTSHTGMYRSNRQTSPGVGDKSFDSDETEVDDSMHDTVDGSPVILQRKENRASQFVLSSEEDEENKHNPGITMSPVADECDTKENIEVGDRSFDSDATDVRFSVHNSKTAEDSPAVIKKKGFNIPQHVLSSDEEEANQSDSITMNINENVVGSYDIYKTDLGSPFHNTKPVLDEDVKKSVGNGKSTLVLESDEEETMDSEVNGKSDNHVIVESSFDEEVSIRQDESVKKKILYESSDEDSDCGNFTKKSLSELTTHRNSFSDKPKQALVSVSSDDEEDDLNSYVSSLKINQSESEFSEDSDNSLKDFIVNDDDDDDDEEDVNVYAKDHELPTKTPKSSSVKPRMFLSESKFNNFATPKSTRSALDKLKVPKSVPGTPAYRREFNKLRDSTLKELLTLFNATVFDGKLPPDLQVTWNKRMTKTAGFCYYSMGFGTRTSRIELSDKVIDSIERTRDTLIHELCHAATWIIDGKKAGHGPAWKYWAKRANKAHPDLPVIARCHQYEIHTKYNYQCNGCGQTFGRHSKSIDATRHRCSQCGGIPELVSGVGSSNATPKTPNSYALFVKKHFAAARKNNPGFSHKEIMQKISAMYRESKEIEGNKENVN